MDPTPASSSSSEEDDRSLPREFFDIIIIGAGISGINTARYITASAPSTTSYAILERRGNLGGTWDLFKYPGIRSDSDMFTFGFSWNPWNLGKPLATGPEITAYLSESAAKVGVDKHIRFHHHVLSASWSSSSSSWTITAKKDNDAYVQYEARFLVLGTGYYNYDEPMQTLIPGLDRFRGDVIKPQFWPEGYKYMNKNIVVIGSGATAVTLLPSLAEDARHVTMLQRSPTYILTMPMTRGIFTRLFLALLPRFVTGPWSRIRHVLMGSFFYYYCKTFPQKARDVLEKASAEQLPRSIPVKPHLSPRYNPWDQRLCVCPDGDFYAALRSSKASIVTDNIKEVTENEIVLESGKKLQPDIIVAATGLQLQFAGGIEISVDGKIVDVSTKFTWKGCMLQDIPNMVFVVGYVNASWTLSAETTAMLFVRLWRRMKTAGARVAIPTLERPEAMKQVSLFYLSSTYFQKSSQVFPKGGLGQWSQKKNHLVDAWESSWGNISDGLVLH